MNNLAELLCATAVILFALEGAWSLPKSRNPSASYLSSLETQEDQNSIEPLNKMCLTRDDCSASSCCTVGMMRYSIPTCLPMGQLGDSCIPENSPRNFTLSYPNGEKLSTIDSFSLLCPCAPGLHCDENINSCIERDSAEGN
ncbi:unnamed protein product [Allacma fusca]|uniref:Prokineticin domain-containing protein n=1 Tax=Allacma fusca TaxID=39272 RepID=A0A8J2LD60_9HEXA|nr:unnamed protein product [Allacma fusca]